MQFFDNRYQPSHQTYPGLADQNQQNNNVVQDLHQPNNSLPEYFKEDLTIDHLYWNPPLLDIPANGMYPDFEVVKHVLNNKTIPETLLNKLLDFATAQTQIIRETRDLNTENLLQKIFRFFAISLQLDYFFHSERFIHSTLEIRSISLSCINLFPHYCLWKQCQANEEMLKTLEKAIKNILRLLRPTQDNINWPNCLKKDELIQFRLWFQAILTKAVKESNTIKELILPRNRKTEIAGVPPSQSQWVKLLYSKKFELEITHIVESDDNQITLVFNKLSLKIPCCDEITATEYFCYNLRKWKRKVGVNEVTEGFFAFPLQLHCNEFFLTYSSSKKSSSPWGHLIEAKPTIILQESDDLSVHLRSSINPSSILHKDKLDQAIEKCTNERMLKLMNQIKEGADLNRFDYFEMKKIKYRVTSCNGDCSKIDTSFEISLTNDGADLIKSASDWTKLTDSQKNLVKDVWTNLSNQLLTPKFNLSLNRLMSETIKSYDLSYFQFPLNDKSVNKVIFEPILEVYSSLNKTNKDNIVAFCFVLDKLLKIFNVYCENPKQYFDGIIFGQDRQKLAELIVHFGATAIRQNPNRPSLGSLKNNLSFFIEVKLKELSQYFIDLESLGALTKVSFDPKPALIIYIYEDALNFQHGCLHSHEYGLSHLTEGYHDETHKELMQMSGYNISSSKTAIPSLFKFIADCWERGYQLIPIIQNQTHKNIKTVSYQGASNNNAKLKEKKRGESLNKLRRKKLSAKNDVLRNEIKKYADRQSQVPNVIKRKDSDDTLSIFQESLLNLPGFLLNLKMGALASVFSAISGKEMVNAYLENYNECLHLKINGPTFQLLELPNDNLSEIEDQPRQTILIDSLFDYQRDAIAKFEAWQMAGCGGIFADEPGLGKTRTACEVLLRSLIEFPERPCLVIAPNLVKSQWVQEFWNVVSSSARTIAKKAFHYSLDKRLSAKGLELMNLVDKVEEKKRKLYFSSVAENQKINFSKEEIDRLEKYLQFYSQFNLKDVRLLTTPKEFQDLMDNLEDTPARGIVIAQLSYFENQFDFQNPDHFAGLNPSVVVIDEAHQILSIAENSKKLSKTTILDYIFRQWSCTKLALTATPLVNELDDMADLLMILTNNEREVQTAEHFEGLIYSLAEKLIKIKNEFKERELGEYVGQVNHIANRCLMTFMWLKEKMINPRIARTTRDEVLDSKAADIEIRKFTFNVIPTKEQYNLHEKIFEDHSQSFFKFTNLVSALLIHPDLCGITQIQLGKKIKIIEKMDAPTLDQYIKQSSLLQKIFLESGVSDNTRTIADSMKANERAIIFVAQKAHAVFISAIAMKKFNMTAQEVFAVHSGNPNGPSEIEQFKALKTRGILLLLPKSGGAGLSFTNVALNILLSVGWTHKDQEQCGGRNTRGEGTKYIGSPAYPFKSAKHVSNIVRKKELLSDLFLDMGDFNPTTLNKWMNKILDAASSIMAAQLDHCEVDEDWDDTFEELKTRLNMELGNGVSFWNNYSRLKSQTEKTEKIVKVIEIEQKEDQWQDSLSNETKKRRIESNDIEVENLYGEENPFLSDFKFSNEGEENMELLQELNFDINQIQDWDNMTENWDMG